MQEKISDDQLGSEKQSKELVLKNSIKEKEEEVEEEEEKKVEFREKD